jgi:thiol-disulfide isomerase/thioredoxin
MDRVLSLVTALVVVTVTYFLVTERVVPALRGEPVRVREGERLVEVIDFEPLSSGGGTLGLEEIRVPNAKPTLLLVFNSACQACYRTLPAWQDLVAVVGDAASVLAVALDPDERAAGAYASQNLDAATAVVPEDPRRFASILGVDIVPSTALLDGDGVLRFMRQGSLDSLAVSSLMRALGALEAPQNHRERKGS